MSNLRKRLAMSPERLKEINDFILAEDNKLVSDLIEIVEKYGGPEQINRKASEARKLENLWALERSYLDKHNALNETANALTRAGIGVIAAANIH